MKDFKQNIRVLQLASGSLYMAKMVMSNDRNCMYRNQTSLYFNCKPPTLDQFKSSNRGSQTSWKPVCFLTLRAGRYSVEGPFLYPAPFLRAAHTNSHHHLHNFQLHLNRHCPIFLTLLAHKLPLQPLLIHLLHLQSQVPLLHIRASVFSALQRFWERSLLRHLITNHPRRPFPCYPTY